MSSQTWIAEDLAPPHRRRRRLLLALGALTVAAAVAAALFVLPGPPQPSSSAREPGHFGRLDEVDLVPGYTLDPARRRLGPARLQLHDGTRLFVPAETPYSGARPCAALTPPEGEPGGSCSVFVWFDQETLEVSWLTVLRPGGPDEALLSGRLVAATEDQLRLDEGISVRRGPSFRLSECGDQRLREVVGTHVVVSVGTRDGHARQVTCRS